MTNADLSTRIKIKALELGFEACGIAQAFELPESERQSYRSWLKAGHQAEMHYLERNAEKRYDPRLLVDGCRSVVVVALNYEPAKRQAHDAPQIATFAYGQDYHKLIRSKLRQLLEAINAWGTPAQGRAFADSAPLAERYWAQKAGLGWIGKNHQLILPGKGSKFLLGELLLDIGLAYDSELPQRCGKCTRCLDACPTLALSESLGLDANRCLSYLTIEKKGSFDERETSWVAPNNRLFGCDICLDACPWNRFAKANALPELQPKTQWLSMKKNDLDQMTEKEFQAMFSGTCLERTGYEGFVRNRKALAGK